MKKNNLKELCFYLLTDSKRSRRGTFSDVEQAFRAGCRILQYREKNKSTMEMIIEARKIKKICGDQAIFLVNDRIDVAMAVDADGIHIGQDDMPFETDSDTDAESSLGETHSSCGEPFVFSYQDEDRVEDLKAEMRQWVSDAVSVGLAEWLQRV